MTRPSAESETIADTSAGTGEGRFAGGIDPGGRLGRYLVLGRLGAGGMGVVYAAYDPELDRKVAVKVLARASERARERLLREARAMARLNHPNVVTVLDVGRLAEASEANADVFVAMEYIDGATLKAWLGAESRTVAQKCAVLIAAGRGLVAAHAQGLVHRDFKPDNVMIGIDGRVRVMDFGLARGPGTAALSDVDPSLTSVSTEDASYDTSLTRTGSVLGTPAYMSPEQHLGLEAGPASDQFSFCVAFWEAIHGERPFAGKTLAALAAEVSSGARSEGQRNPDVPAWLNKRLDRGLEAVQENRWPSVEALLDAIEQGLSPRSKSWGRAVAIGGLGLGAFALTLANRPDLSVPVCDGGQAMASQLWDATRASALQARFEASGLSFGTLAATHAQAQMAEFARGYARGHDAACRDTQIQGTQSAAWMDARVACLEEARAEVEAIVDASLIADAALVERSASVFDALPDPSDCADVAFIEQRMNGDMAPRPEQRAQVNGVRRELAAARGRKRAGDYAGARVQLEALATQLDTLDFRPLRAELEFSAGQLEFADGDHAAATTHYEAALTAALESRHAQVISESMASLATLRARDPASRAEALRLIDYAEAAGAQWSGDPQRRAKLFSDRGLVYDMSGDFASAEAAHREALSQRESAYGSDHPRVAEDLHNLGIVLRLQNKTKEAREAFDRALKIRLGAYGEAHPVTARSLNSLANLEFRSGNLPGAKVMYERVLEAKRAAFGGEHVSMSNGYSMLGVIARRSGELDRAVEMGQRAVDLAVEAKADARSLASVRSNYALALQLASRYDDALVVQRRALVDAKAAYGGDHPGYAAFLTNAAAAARAAGELEAARGWLDAAIDLRESKLDANDPRLAANRYDLAQVLVSLKLEHDRAVALASRAWIALRSTGEASPQADEIEQFFEQIGAKLPALPTAAPSVETTP